MDSSPFSTVCAAILILFLSMPVVAGALSLDVISGDTSGGSCFSTSTYGMVTTGENNGTSRLIVNVQLDLEEEDDLKNIDAILSKIESYNRVTTVFVTGSFASTHPDIVTDIEARGHTIGVYGWSSGEDLSVLSYDTQKNLIDRAISSVKSAVQHPRNVVDFKPQNLRYNDDTITILQDFNMRSITATFSSDESFVTCPYAKSLGIVTFPYPVSTDFFAVPLSAGGPGSSGTTASGTSETLSSTTETLDYDSLVTEYGEHLQTRDPMVIAVDPSGSTSTVTATLDFIDYAEGNGGVIKALAPLTTLSTYLSSLTITDAPEHSAPGDIVTLTMSYTTTLYCPTYFFRVYGKFPSDSDWTLLDQQSYYVPTGSHTFSSAFPIPENPDNETPYQVTVVGRGCVGNLECWPQVDSYEAKDSTTIRMNPVITDITIENAEDPDLPAITNQDIKFTSVLSDESGSDTIVKTLWSLKKNDGESIESKIFDGFAKTWTMTPPVGTHGKSVIQCEIIFGDNNPTNRYSEEFKLYFNNEETTYATTDGMAIAWPDENSNDAPDWYDFWMKDGAVPSMTGFRYKEDDGYGGCYPDGTLELNSLAAWIHYPNTIKVNVAGNTETFGGPSVRGSDCAAEVVGHELFHHYVLTSLKGTGTDSDVWQGPNWGTYTIGSACPDELPDWYELTSDTDPAFPDTWDVEEAKGFKPRYQHDYATYGDQELMAMRAGNNLKGITENDWAYPGKQSGFPDSASSLEILNSLATPNSLEAPRSLEVIQKTEFIGNISDYGVDSDGNGMYNNLIVGIDVNISNSNYYAASALLRGGNGQRIARVNSVHSFQNSKYFVTFTFDGREIFESGINGPYNVSFVIADLDGEEIDNKTDLYKTAAYEFSDFEKMHPWLIGGYSDFGSNPDDEGKFGNLSVVVTTDAITGGNYVLEGYLVSEDWTILGFSQNSTTLHEGPGSIILDFNGTDIAKNGFDGPYTLGSLTLLDADRKRLDYLFTAYNTTAYHSTDFQPPVAVIQDNFEDYGEDADYDELFEHLVITAGVDITRAGNYSITGTLSDENGSRIGEARVTSLLETGSEVVELSFDGQDIVRHGVNGPFTLSYLSIFYEDETFVDSRTNAHTTQAYDYTGFSSGGVITGTAQDFSGNPVAGADVYVSGPVVTSTKTDNNGDYKVTRLDTGVYTVLIEAADPNLMRGTGSTAVTQGTPVILNIQLDEAGSIGGNVRNADGAGIANVIVYYSGYETPRFRTDENGYYLIPRLAAGSYEIVVDASTTEYVDSSSNVTISLGGTTEADFVLITGGSITGTVTDTNLNPLSSIYVTAAGEGSGEAITDSSGGFIISRLTPGSYVVTAHPHWTTGFVSNSTEVSVVAGNAVTAKIVIPVGGTIRGTVLSDNGEPITNVYVQSDSTESFAYTDTKGNYSIIGLSTGTYTITADPSLSGDSPYLPGSADVNIETGQTVEQDFVLITGGTLQGNVTSEDKEPVLNAYVYVEGYNGTFKNTFTNENGGYSVIGLPADTFSVIVTPDEYSPLLSSSADITVETGQAARQDFVLITGGTLQGTVSDTGGEPVSTSYVSVYGYNGTFKYTFSSDDGSYSITGLPTDTYTVTADPPYGSDYVASSEEVFVGAGQTIERNFTLGIGGILQGTVTSELGEPVENAYVNAYGSGTEYGYAYTDAEGNYTINSLPASTYTVTVKPPSGSAFAQATAHVNVEAGQTVVQNFILGTGGIIQGMVSTGQGEPVVNAIVVAYNPTGGYGYSLTDTGGNYAIGGLPAGIYTTIATPPEGSTLDNATATVNVGEGQTVTQNFILPSSAIQPLPDYYSPPTDPDGDGLYEDLNANGFSDWDDAGVLFWNTEWIQANEPVAGFDFNGNTFIDWDDAVVLFWSG